MTPDELRQAAAALIARSAPTPTISDHSILRSVATLIARASRPAKAQKAA